MAIHLGEEAEGKRGPVSVCVQTTWRRAKRAYAKQNGRTQVELRECTVPVCDALQLVCEAALALTRHIARGHLCLCEFLFTRILCPAPETD